MLELGIFHNGAVDLDSNVVDGTRVNAGTLDETSESFQRVLVNQVRQGILAEELGFNYWFMTEHHMQPEGVEFSPNPILAETAIAAQTSRIRLGQMANILPWHHPIRLAEQGAMLDVISGGRLEFGVGRGYQSRETEVLGGAQGATIQDQERNRSFFEECFQIINKAWREHSFSHTGEFFNLPPSYTKWGNPSTIAYFSQEHVDRDLDSVLDIGAPDMYASGPPVYATGTTLKEISVYPHPIQKPVPPMWMPVTSPRSIEWAAANGVNCYTIPEPNSRLKANVERYYETLERTKWPDRLDREGPWKFGYDADVKRGFAPARYVHILKPGDEQNDLERYKLGMEAAWPYLGAFGFGGVITDIDEPPPPPDRPVTADLCIDKGLAFVGTADQIVEQIMAVKETVGYEDFMFTCWFEMGGYRGEETEEQMHMFADQCMPALADACGGLVVNPDVGPALTGPTNGA